MVIYVEQVLIDNFIIDFFILLSLKKVLKANFKKLNIILSSVLGAVCSLIIPLFNFNVMLSGIFKILLSLSMILMLKKWQKFKEFGLFYITFLLLTCLFGGVCLFILIMFDKNFSMQNYSTYSLPLGVICVIIFFVYIIIKNIFKNFYKRKIQNNFVYKIILSNDGNSDEILAFLDTGNNLTDTLTNKPITIVEFNALKNVVKEISITDIVLNKQNKLNKIFKNVHMQNVSSVGKVSNKIIVVQIEKIEIYFENNVHTINDAMIGLTLKNFISNMGYSALLNPSLF